MALKCAICGKEYPAGTAMCPADSGALLPTAASNSTDLQIGTVFADKYEIISVLGEGGMSRVYKARHNYMKRVVAIKLLHYLGAEDPVAAARFQLEAQAASALSHPNVVTVHDYGLTPDGRAFFIMDCLEGESLDDVLQRKGHLQLEEAIDIFTQVCEGLDHAHKKGIIHRDVKPSNLVLLKQEDGSRIVKLVDFGIAKLVRKASDEEIRKQQQLTQTGEIFGTPAYMSPEQCQGRQLDARSDIYSFGCLMYECLAGMPPLVGATFVNTAVKHVNEKPKPLTLTAAIEVPPELDAVILKCLEKSPSRRYQSAAELRQALFDASYAAGLKGLRVGAIPVPRIPELSDDSGLKQKAQEINRQEGLSKRTVYIGSATVCLALATAFWGLFVFQGPPGDTGVLYDKLRWQWGIAYADELMRKNEYAKAADMLEKCEDIARGFGDDGRKLETTLQKEVEAYGRNHDAAKLEEVNNDLVALATQKVFAEYETLMKLLKEWEEPVSTNVQREQRARLAVAFGERISHCADKLAIRARTKQENLLKRAIKVFDLLNLREGTFRSRFRIQLADVYRQQLRTDEQRSILAEAVEHAPKNPHTKEGWSLKIEANFLFGVLNSSNNNLDKAKQELEDATKWSKEHLGEGETYRDCLLALADLYKKSPDSKYQEQSKSLTEEAKAVTAQLDADDNKD